MSVDIPYIEKTYQYQVEGGRGESNEIENEQDDDEQANNLDQLDGVEEEEEEEEDDDEDDGNVEDDVDAFLDGVVPFSSTLFLASLQRPFARQNT